MKLKKILAIIILASAGTASSTLQSAMKQPEGEKETFQIECLKVPKQSPSFAAPTDKELAFQRDILAIYYLQYDGNDKAPVPEEKDQADLKTIAAEGHIYVARDGAAIVGCLVAIPPSIMEIIFGGQGYELIRNIHHNVTKSPFCMVKISVSKPYKTTTAGRDLHETFKRDFSVRYEFALTVLSKVQSHNFSLYRNQAAYDLCWVIRLQIPGIRQELISVMGSRLRPAVPDKDPAPIS